MPNPNFDYTTVGGAYAPPPASAVPEPSYTLGPISAGANSPLGGVLGFLGGISQNFGAGLDWTSRNYAAGLQLATASPATAGAILAGQPVSAQAVAQAMGENTNPSGSPFVGAGQVIGGILGTGVNALGITVGTAGHGAAPGVAAGAQAGTQGVAEVGAAGATGAFGGAISGLGLGTTQGISGFSPNLLFVAAVVLVVILASR